MDWFAVYGKLIEYRRKNILVYIKGKTPGIERHHIVPISQNGLDDCSNIVCLTSREHYVAHKMLHKMYPRNVYLLNAVYKMAKMKNTGKHNTRLYRVSSRDIEFLRKELNYFLRNSKWINDGNGNRHRIWVDDPIPNGWFIGMGKSSNAFQQVMNERAKKQNPIIIDGVVYSPKDISEKYGIPRDQILKRLKAGWSAEKIVCTPYIKPDHTFTDADMCELRMLFEEWKTTKTSDLISRHPDIFQGRHGKIDGIRLVTFFSKKIPEYAKLKTDPNNIHSVCQITYNGMTRTIAEWGHKTGIPCDVIRARYAAGWKPEDIFTKPVIKPGQNLADDEEMKEQKRLLVEQMFITYKDAGYGFAGHKAVCVKFNLDICYDALIRKFKQFGLAYNKPLDTFDYHGERKTLAELVDLSGLSKHLLYDRLVRRNLLSEFSIDDLLKKDLPDMSEKREEKKRIEMYEKFKPMFDLYLEENGGLEGYKAVCEKFGYDADYCNLRRQFNKYVPEYKEYRQKCIDNQFRIEYNGQMLTPFEISKLTGVGKSLICSRLNDGWDIYDAVSTPAGFESDYEYRRNELSDQFRYWSEHGFSEFNDRFNTTYKNEGCVTSLFRKYFRNEYDAVVRDRKIVLTVDGKSYTIRELAEKTGNTVVTCRERISRGCSVEEIMKSGKLVDANSPEHIEKMRKILIPYFESYSRRGFAEVKKDFPDCEYRSGGALRIAFNGYIPDLYKPENNGAELRVKMGEQITIDGVTKAIGEWAREYGLSVGKIRQRLDYGITGKDLLKKEWLNANQVEYRGKTYNGYAELAREFGIDRSTLLNRLKRGMTIDEALSKPVRPKTKR